MKTYTASFGQVASRQVKHDHPERTAYRVSQSLAGDYTFKVWPSRSAMLTTIRMQERRASHYTDWKAVIPFGTRGIDYDVKVEGGENQ